MPPVYPRGSYNVGIICALDVEKAAVEATLDEEHGGVTRLKGDDNVYSFGRMGAHYVVVACLPAGVTGKGAAATVAKDMMRSFPIKVGLMVGICGGVWSEKRDIRLGDVVVSQPDGKHGGVVQWDYGKMEKDGEFRRTGTLNKPPRPLLNAVQALKAKHRRHESEVPTLLEKMLSNNPIMKDEHGYGYQGAEHDELFEASYDHPAGDTCKECDRARLVRRPDRKAGNKPKIHYGNIASGDEVVKDGPTRDRIAEEEGILCFEMEAAGLMETFPCVVIRGVCDYADSHKNKRWQPYAAATAACYAKEFLGVVHGEGIEQLGLANYCIPFDMSGIPVTAHFVERADDSEKLEAFFQDKSKETRRKIFVVHGTGGMGKTQLCVEYIRKQKNAFDAIFWLDGSSRDAVRKTSAEAASRLPGEERTKGTASADVQGQSQAAADVDELLGPLRRWLSLPANTNWLLVLDNVDRDWQTPQKDPQAYDFHKCLPTADHGNVLITTRLARLGQTPTSLELRKVDNTFGREILESRAGKGLKDADKLLAKLDGLPLALVLAGAYLQQTNKPVGRYLQDYDEKWAELMKLQNRDQLQDYAKSFLTTWEMSFEQVQNVKPEAARLFEQWAFFHAGDLWYELAAKAAQARSSSTVGHNDIDDGDASEASLDELSFEDSLGILRQYSLISVDENSVAFSIHPVVHMWTLHNIVRRGSQDLMCARAITAVSKLIPTSDSARDLKMARRLVPHARKAAQCHLQLPEDAVPAIHLYRLASLLSGWDPSDDVERLYLRALPEDETAFGADQLWKLKTKNALANFYTSQGKLKKAEALYVQVLGEQAFSLDNMNNLGCIHKNKVKTEEAQLESLQALREEVKITEAMHRLIPGTISGLATLYGMQGMLQEAEDLHMWALQMNKDAFGPTHRSGLVSVHGLATVYKKQGKMREAEAMYQRALRGFEEAYGLEDENTFHIARALADLYSEQGKMKEAEAMYMRALRGFEEAYGPEDELTVDTVHSLAIVYEKQGKMREAEAMYKRALQGFEEAYGPEHTSSLTTVCGLAVLYHNYGKYVAAREMCLRAIEGYRLAEGDHEADIQRWQGVLAHLQTHHES